MNLHEWIVPLALTLVAPATAQGAQPASPQPLEVNGRGVELDITSVSPATIRVRLSPFDSSGQPAPAPDGPGLVAREWPKPLLRLRSSAGPLKIQAGNLTVTVNAEDLSILVESSGAGASQELRIAKNSGEMAFRLGTGPVFGLGQGGLQFDRRGRKHSLTSVYDPPDADMLVYGTRTPVPWLMGAQGWALFINRPKGEVDLTGAEGRLVLSGGAPPLPLDVFVALAEPPQLMREYAALTGLPRMPPLWSLGYMQSHRTLQDRDEVMGIARKLRELKFPCDALIYLGTGFAPSGWNHGNGDFTWNEKVFPNPKRDMAELQGMNFRVILHVARVPSRLFGSVDDTPADPTDPNQVSVYWRKHAPSLFPGVAGWWPDEGEQLSDEGRLARNRMYWEGSLRERPAERPFSLHRSGYAGMQRYGAWLWTGDPASTWKTLAAHVAIGINTGLSGIPMWGHDIGGFFATPEFTGELFVRWFQFGAFSPLFRSHGMPSHLHFPWSWNSGTFGPPELNSKRPGIGLPDASELHNPDVEPICRRYAELRYRLLPYLYSAVRETSESGLPVMRALWLHYSDDPAASARGDEYLWGRDMLVAPVLEKGASSRRLYLPRGDWYDFWTNRKIQGGREIERPVDLETMPLYVRAGAILPMGPIRRHTADRPDAPIELVVYPGADGSTSLYRDDGSSFAFEKGAFSRIRCEWNDASRELGIRPADGSGPARVTFTARLAGSTAAARSVEFTGKPLRIKL